MNKRLLSVALVGLAILAVTVAAIFIAKGYRFDRTTGSIHGTGIIAVSSIPSGASIYLNGDLISASNNTINDLAPQVYRLKVTKDGFSSWEKDLLVEAEKVSLVNVTLFPVTPDLRPLTFTGLTSPILSPDGGRIVYATNDPVKVGLWVLDISNRPFTFSRDPKHIAKDTLTFTFSKSTFQWAPDSKTLLVNGTAKNGLKVNYLLDTDRFNDIPTDITSTLDQTKASWQVDLDLKNKDRLDRLQEEVRSTVSKDKSERWSPDELKFAASIEGEIQVYDLKKRIFSKIGKPKDFGWYPDSDHLILIEEGLVSIIESDGTNKTAIYGGSFEDSAVFPWPDGSKLVILTSFNKQNGLNLYSINLR